MICGVDAATAVGGFLFFGERDRNFTEENYIMGHNSYPSKVFNFSPTFSPFIATTDYLFCSNVVISRGSFYIWKLQHLDILVPTIYYLQTTSNLLESTTSAMGVGAHT